MDRRGPSFTRAVRFYGIRQGSEAPVYYVGFNVLYRSKHIPGAVYAGPGAKPEGIELLKRELRDVSRDKENRDLLRVLPD